MMIRFLNSKENLISKAGDGTVMSFHSRIMINPGAVYHGGGDRFNNIY